MTLHSPLEPSTAFHKTFPILITRTHPLPMTIRHHYIIIPPTTNFRKNSVYKLFFNFNSNLILDNFVDSLNTIIKFLHDLFEIDEEEIKKIFKSALEFSSENSFLTRENFECTRNSNEHLSILPVYEKNTSNSLRALYDTQHQYGVFFNCLNYLPFTTLH